MTESEFTGTQLVYAHQGGWLEVEVSLPPMTYTEAQDWIGFLAALRGQFGTFWLSDPDYTLRGSQSTNAAINGASQSGTTVAIDGLDTSESGVLKRGDYLRIGDNLYLVTEDATSNGSGEANVEIFPALRSTPNDDDTVYITSDVKGKFRLSSNEVSWTANDLNHYGITFAAREAF